jgi:phytoene/squalene synthetase
MESATTVAPASTEMLPARVSNHHLGRALGNLYFAAEDLEDAWYELNELNEPNSFVDEVLRDVERAAEALREMGVEAK